MGIQYHVTILVCASDPQSEARLSGPLANQQELPAFQAGRIYLVGFLLPPKPVCTSCNWERANAKLEKSFFKFLSLSVTGSHSRAFSLCTGYHVTSDTLKRQDELRRQKVLCICTVDSSNKMGFDFLTVHFGLSKSHFQLCKSRICLLAMKITIIIEYLVRNIILLR